SNCCCYCVCFVFVIEKRKKQEKELCKYAQLVLTKNKISGETKNDYIFYNHQKAMTHRLRWCVCVFRDVRVC
ncbi:hypothetical protein M5D96_010823, partial [Drosophila gunungcola]